MTTNVIHSVEPQLEKKRQVDIDFLFLDLNTCTRCVGTGKNLEAAIEAVSQTLALTNVHVNVNPILIDSDEKAQLHQFVTSPTVRVNGRDIALETRESLCDSCTDLCGCDTGTACRVWLYQGEEYTEAPVPMLIEAILQEAYRVPVQGVSNRRLTPPDDYEKVPENLQRFFAGVAEKTAVASSCCSVTEQQSCCEPTEKASCCDAEATSSGGCGCK